MESSSAVTGHVSEPRCNIEFLPDGSISQSSLLGYLPPPHYFLLSPDPAARDLYADVRDAGGARGDSGTDLRFAEDAVIPPTASIGGLPVIIGLKVRARNFSTRDFSYCPYEIRPRSSIAKTPLGLANSIGTIDAGYTGELKVAIRNHSAEPFAVKRGDSLFQLVRPGLSPAAVLVVDPGCPAFQDGSTLRGAGGFGSTGAAGAGPAGVGTDAAGAGAAGEK